MGSENFRILAALLILFLFFGNAFAVLESGSLKIFAVTEEGKGMAADLKLDTFAGKGYVTFVTSNISGEDHPLIGNDTQTTGNIALKIAKVKVAGIVHDVDFSKYNYQFDIIANATEVDGPSAGAAMTLLAYSVLSERQIPKGVGLTGTINSDGTVGVVGGVYAKAQAAAGVGIKLFMIPKGEALQVVKGDDGKVVSINLLSYGPEKLDLKVVEIDTIDDVIKYAFADIGSIVVDVNSMMVGFTPRPIKYNKSLEPMKEFSQSFINRADALAEDAKKNLEVTTLEEYWKGIFYSQIKEAERDIDSAGIFFDQNYLYSSANDAFNAAINLNTIKEIAGSPSLLSEDSAILGSKISALRGEISFLKEKFDFIPVDRLDWFIAAQQRIAYAENALDNIGETEIPFGEMTEAQKNGELYGRIREFASAQLWVEAAKDFLAESEKSSSKKEPLYSADFVMQVAQKISDINYVIANAPDQNISRANISEAARRLRAAKISYDNNFYFAALYDAYFAESFISSEVEMRKFDGATLFENLDEEIRNIAKEAKSEWAMLFLDHSQFYLESAKFYNGQGTGSKAASDLSACFSTLTLAKNVDSARSAVDKYIAAAGLPDKAGGGNGPLVQITYTEKPDIYRLLILASGIALVLLLLAIIVLGIGSSSGTTRGSVNSKIARLQYVLSNLDRSLAKKKISEVEYFFLKKRYDGELNELQKRRKKCSDLVLTLDESKAKVRALQRGMKDLKKHYAGGLILTDDYVKHSLEVSQEIANLNAQIEMQEVEFRKDRQVPAEAPMEVFETAPKKISFAFVGNIFKSIAALKDNFMVKIQFIKLPFKEKLKGTSELGKEEMQEELQKEMRTEKEKREAAMEKGEKKVRREKIRQRKDNRTKSA